MTSVTGSNWRYLHKQQALFAQQLRQLRHVVGNGWKPTLLPAQPGGWIVAPLLPHSLQRARCLSRLLDTFGPQRMTATAQAKGA